MIGGNLSLKTVNVTGFQGYGPPPGFGLILSNQSRVLEPYPSSWGYVSSPWSWVKSVGVGDDERVIGVSFYSGLKMTVDLRLEDA